jgi:AcrR family transcriptional regulator
VAKGVLHRHFDDFDGFLAELVHDRVARLDAQGAALRAAAGTGTVAGNLAGALAELFGPVAVAIVSLVIFRDGLRARLRRSTPAGLPLLTEAAAMLAAYLAAERDLGRIAAGADPGALAPMLVGSGHLAFADRTAAPPGAEAVRKLVTAVMAGASPGPRPSGRG